MTASETTSLLFEIRTAEIPTGYIEPALKQIRSLLPGLWRESQLLLPEGDGGPDHFELYATARRMIVWVPVFPRRQATIREEIKGPPVDIALKDGKIQKPLEGFLKKAGISESGEAALKKLERRVLKGKEYFFCRKESGGAPAAEILPDLFLSLLEKLQFPKKMYWNEYRFLYPRPITGLTLLLGKDNLPLEIAGVKSTATSTGHFIQSPKSFDLKNIPEDLFGGLKKNKVLYDQTERRALILEQLTKAAKAENLELIPDDDLLDTVNYLVEDPHVVTCKFPEKFLEIPAPVVISEMREHQKYFALRDKKGNLSNTFLVVANMPATDFIRKGNERVLVARLEDGRFYYEEDQQTPLRDRVEKFDSILYQKELGTLREKLDRVTKIALAANQTFLDKDQRLPEEILRETTLLCKADLTTMLVYEFPHLQGEIGGIYARQQGLPEETARAIEEHYRPVYQGDRLPGNRTGLLISLAEKLENILGNFAIGKRPSGSADPLALRRQAMAVIEILIALDRPVNLTDWLEQFVSLYPAARDKKGQPISLVAEVWKFIAGRAQAVLGERGLPRDFIQAALNTSEGVNYGNIAGIFQACEELSNLHDQAPEQFTSLLQSFKRMANILKGDGLPDRRDLAAKMPDKSLMTDEAEKMLAEHQEQIAGLAEKLKSGKGYRPFLTHLSGMKKDVDAFFDQVMVMAEDKKVRENRLRLLAGLVVPLEQILDLQSIEVRK